MDHYVVTKDVQRLKELFHAEEHWHLYKTHRGLEGNFYMFCCIIKDDYAVLVTHPYASIRASAERLLARAGIKTLGTKDHPVYWMVWRGRMPHLPALIKTLND